jgi:allophanate hydrolase
MQLDLGSLRALYKSGAARPSEVIASVYDRMAAQTESPIWISVAPRERVLAKARKLEQAPLAAALPLYGVPFAVQDNIDVAGIPTTAGCPAYTHSPARSAAVVQLLTEAGAIAIGKTNMDQFGAGLAGTQSPYGACSSVFGKGHISGGSSSGSAVAVATGIVSFALGMDTAGSGLVPAAFNNLVGLKPTRGVLSTRGLVPACRTLDCVSIFATNCNDAHTVWTEARGFDPDDSYSRAPRPGQDAAPWVGGPFSFGVPASGQLEFFGDDAAAELYANAVAALEHLGGHRVEIDFSVFRAASELLSIGPWMAERYAALRGFFDAHAPEVHPLVRENLEQARRYSAADYFEAEYRLRDLRRHAEAQWDNIDVLLLPTAGTIYTHEEAAADAKRINTNLGYYTNFINLLDLAAVAVPAGFRPNGLPVGVSFIGPAFSEEALLALADRFHRAQPATPGAPLEPWESAPGCVSLAVVGAHLAGKPLNRQLAERGGRLVRVCRTGPEYRLYELEGAIPPKLGLVRDTGFRGPGIEVEVWAVPEDQFGSVAAELPSPLAVGNAVLEDGARVKCFTCEPLAIARATEITQFGGWRGYLSQSALTR